ncbi:hypothetical protein Q1695_003195 [Nippostrongylus brasiliensis]|nr:hypothetical protein Q1695_003195 [Nippostrongylus brasiliensis]
MHDASITAPTGNNAESFDDRFFCNGSFKGTFNLINEFTTVNHATFLNRRSCPGATTHHLGGPPFNGFNT